MGKISDSKPQQDPSSTEEIERLSHELTAYSFKAASEFKRASNSMATILNPQEFQQWLRLGFELGTVTGRAWDCAAEYFKSSPDVVGVNVFAFLDLYQWVSHGKELATISCEAATSYFRHSPIFIRQADLRDLDKWVQLGRKLADNNWKSTKLVAAYFPASLECLPVFGFKGLEEWVEVAVILASRDHDMACAFIESSPHYFITFTEEERSRALQLIKAMALRYYGDVPKLLLLLGQHHRKIKAEVRKLSYEICFNIARHSSEHALKYLESCPTILSQIESINQLQVMEMGLRLSELCWEAALEFLNKLPAILAMLPMHKVEPWFEAGLGVTAGNLHAGIAYYAMESKRSQEELTKLQRTVHLEDVKSLLQLYAEGLTALRLKIKKTEAEGFFNGVELPATDGEFIYLPERVAGYEDYVRNFKWYKVAVAHQAGYYEYGAFDFRIRLLKQLGLKELPANLGEKVDGSGRNDLEGFFQVFKEPRLAATLFKIIEDGRVDYLLRHNYRGLKRDMLFIIEQAQAKRPLLSALSPRAAAFELLVRITTTGQLNEKLDPLMERLQKFFQAEIKRILHPRATVYDSATATARLYPVIRNLPAHKGQRAEVIEALAGKLDSMGEDIKETLDMLSGQMEVEGEGGELSCEESMLPDILEFRGDTKPEEVQKLMKLKAMKENIQKLSEQGVPLPLELLKQLLKMGADIDITDIDADSLENSTGLFITNIDGLSELRAYKKIKDMLEEEPETAYQLLSENNEIDTSQESTYYYDEWDYLINDYRSKWCKLKEVVPGEGDTRFVEDTLEEHAELVASIRRQFQLLKPEVFRKVKRLENGEEIDIDAAIEALIDRKCGQTPSEKVYYRRDKRERDVSTLFLLDVSASTDEDVEKEKNILSPDDPSWQDNKYSNYPRFAQATDGQVHQPVKKKKGKRIIDVEKEALVLMAEALESIGDEYAIFGFSGYGRDNVEFFNIKEFKQLYTDKVKSHIGAVKPQRSTRMGPAIRHAIRKLENTASKLKILILLSDGYPQDFDYGKDRTSKEYGIQDTAMALREVRERNIHPFLITVDPAGNDYLKEMCGEKEYMVINKVSSLPQELLRTYRTLTYI